MRDDVLIVGHGPGFAGRSLGSEIDGHDTVVRFGDGGYWQKPIDYGIRTKYILTGDQRIADIINIGIVPRETWVYGRPGFRDEKFIMARLKKFNPVICTATDCWLQRFKEIGATGYCSERTPGEPFMSQGLAAVIMTADRLKPERIRLIGCQALLSGNGDQYDSGVNRGRVITAEHDFAAERRLLDEVKKEYGFEVIDGLDS